MPATPTISSEEDALTGFNFALELEGVMSGYFTEANGIGSENEIIEHKVVDENAHEITKKIPGRLKWTDITLKRGITSSMDIWDWRKMVEDGDVSLLQHEAELALIRKMIQLPEVMTRAAIDLAPHHLCYYAQELASAFHTFYQDCRIISSEPEDAPLTKARLKLVSAAKHVLANTLRIIGVDTPERM